MLLLLQTTVFPRPPAHPRTRAHMQGCSLPGMSQGRDLLLTRQHVQQADRCLLREWVQLLLLGWAQQRGPPHPSSSHPLVLAAAAVPGCRHSCCFHLSQSLRNQQQQVLATQGPAHCLHCLRVLRCCCQRAQPQAA
jgi:hypothetical protein